MTQVEKLINLTMLQYYLWLYSVRICLRRKQIDVPCGQRGRGEKVTGNSFIHKVEGEDMLTLVNSGEWEYESLRYL